MPTKEQVNTVDPQTLSSKTLAAPVISGGSAAGTTLAACLATADPVVNLGVATKQYVDTHLPPPPPASSLPQGYLYAFSVNNDPGDTVNDLTISQGVARSAANLADIISATPITKRADAAWAAGSGLGGMFTGTFAANTSYHVFVIYDPVGLVFDAGFDTDINAVNRPAAFTAFRRVASFKTGASASWPQFRQNGRKFEFLTPINDIDFAATAARSLQTLTSLPTGKSFEVLLDCVAVANFYLTNPAATDLAPSLTVAPLSTIAIASGTMACQARVTTNTTAQIGVRASGAANFKASMIAYYDDFDAGIISGGTVTIVPRAGTPLVRSPLVVNSTLTQAHNLGAIPDFVSLVLECLTAEFNYSVGDKIMLSSSHIPDTNTAANSGLMTVVDAVNVSLLMSANVWIFNKTTFVIITLTPANWKATLTPFKFV